MNVIDYTDPPNQPDPSDQSDPPGKRKFKTVKRQHPMADDYIHLPSEKSIQFWTVPNAHQAYRELVKDSDKPLDECPEYMFARRSRLIYVTIRGQQWKLFCMNSEYKPGIYKINARSFKKCIARVELHLPTIKEAGESM